ncbi:MAG: hypothetical protein WAM60_25335 [Candidatus Promineifilaceae bacterium]
MPTFQEFATKAKVRPDYGDMIQVRYRHTDGVDYDTWISGEEVLQRLASETAEQRLQGLSKLDWTAVQEAVQRLPDEGKQTLKRKLIDRFADEVKGAIGGNPIGDSFSDAIRGTDSDEAPYEAEREKWRTFLTETPFRAKVLELAWIQLEGSFPDDDHEVEEPDDWM